MQIHPLVTVKKAATALGVDREVIRNMIDIGAIRGERRFIKNKEKWFLYQEEVQEILEKRAQELSEQAARTTMEGLGEFFQPTEEVPVDGDDAAVNFDAQIEIDVLQKSDVVETESSFSNAHETESLLVTEVDDSEEDHPDRLYLQTTQHTLDQILNSLTIEFAQRLCEERQIICNLKQQLDERNQILADIPDLRQKLDEVKALQEAKDAEIATRDAAIESQHSEIESRDAEIATLRANIGALETNLSWWKQPWWNRLFSKAPQS